MIEALWVFEVPMALPLDTRGARRRAQARARGAGAGEGGGGGVRGRRGRDRGRARAAPARRSCTRPSGAAWRRSCWPPRSRSASAAARSRRQAGPARHVRGRDDALRGQQGAVPGGADRAARRGPGPDARGRRAARDPGRSCAGARSLGSRGDVRPRGRSGPGRLLGGDLGAARRAHRVRARRGSALARAARRRARPVVGGGRRAVHDRHGARARRAGGGRASTRPRSSSPPRTATTPTSWSPRSPSAASRSRG